MVECAFAKSIKQNPKYCDLKSRDLQELSPGGCTLVSSHRELLHLKGCRGFSGGSGRSTVSREGRRSCCFGCFVDLDEPTRTQCVLPLTATWLGNHIGNVTTWDSDRSRRVTGMFSGITAQLCHKTGLQAHTRGAARKGCARRGCHGTDTARRSLPRTQPGLVAQLSATFSLPASPTQRWEGLPCTAGCTVCLCVRYIPNASI